MSREIVPWPLGTWFGGTWSASKHSLVTRVYDLSAFSLNQDIIHTELPLDPVISLPEGDWAYLVNRDISDSL